MLIGLMYFYHKNFEFRIQTRKLSKCVYKLVLGAYSCQGEVIIFFVIMLLIEEDIYFVRYSHLIYCYHICIVVRIDINLQEKIVHFS